MANPAITIGRIFSDTFAGISPASVLPYEEWILPDPAGQTIDHVRPIRDDIERRVRHLLTELNVPTTS